jgi:transposase
MDAKALKDRIAEARRDRRRVPMPLQAAALQYAEQRQAAGISMKAIGGELGMSWHTLSYWRARHASSSETSLARVKIVVPERSKEAVVVHSPSGLRIEGLCVSQMAELIARLR